MQTCGLEHHILMIKLVKRFNHPHILCSRPRCFEANLPMNLCDRNLNAIRFVKDPINLKKAWGTLRGHWRCKSTDQHIFSCNLSELLSLLSLSTTSATFVGGVKNFEVRRGCGHHKVGKGIFGHCRPLAAHERCLLLRFQLLCSFKVVSGDHNNLENSV